MVSERYPLEKPGHQEHRVQFIMPENKRTMRGFSLVEMAVVVAIIGIVIGGVMVGQNLLRNAALRSVVTDAQNYIKAITLFRDSYKDLPGDFASAADVWGSNDGCATPRVKTKKTFNGNGNGRVDGTVNAGEQYWVWQHLAAAGMIDGAFTGCTGPGPVVGENLPASRIEGAGFFMNFGNYNGYIVYGTSLAAPLGHLLYYGASNTENTAMPILSPEDAQSLDTKADDGTPNLGFIRQISTGSGTCYTDAGGGNVTYKISSNDIACPLVFITAIP